MPQANISPWIYYVFVQEFLMLSSLFGGLCIFLVFSQDVILRCYRLCIALCATVAFLSTVHMAFSLYQLQNTYILIDAMYHSPYFYDASIEYINLLYALPLILMAYIMVFEPHEKKTSLILRLSTCALGMVAFYFLTHHNLLISKKIVYFLLYNTFLFYILFVLNFELTPILRHEKLHYFPTMQRTRRVIMLSWLAYPILDLYSMTHAYCDKDVLSFFYIFINIFTIFMPIICIFIIAYTKSKPLPHTTSM